MQQSIQRSTATKSIPSAKFAMNRLEFGASDVPSEALSAPPYELFQGDGSYNIYFNMLGIPQADIRIGLDEMKNQITVFAQREKKYFTDQFLWVFSLPASADVQLMTSYYKDGVVQFTFPKRLAA